MEKESYERMGNVLILLETRKTLENHVSDVCTWMLPQSFFSFNNILTIGFIS